MKRILLAALLFAASLAVTLSYSEPGRTQEPGVTVYLPLVVVPPPAFDLPAWVTIQTSPCPEAFRLVAATYLDESESGGLHHVFTTVLDAQDQPLAGVAVTLAWPDGQDVRYTDSKGEVDHPLWASFDPAREDGPYSLWVEPPSDITEGLGLPLNRHVVYELTFRRMQ